MTDSLTLRQRAETCRATAQRLSKNPFAAIGPAADAVRLANETAHLLVDMAEAIEAVRDVVLQDANRAASLAG